MANALVEARMRVAREFAEWLREELGDIVLDIRVFGSTARGDVHEESDVDVFFLVSRPLTMDEKLEVAGKMFDLLMETDIFVQWVEQTQERWETPLVRESGFGRAVRQEGVPV
ncbi:MAG: nucleotidyltransferase domain-containing protein [candidate division WS1 bacterium]|nr:nucleotidyltransferase domain-containing protein [candidate division WS1 bacterium]